jgi:hypothetical protein
LQHCSIAALLRRSSPPCFTWVPLSRPCRARRARSQTHPRLGSRLLQRYKSCARAAHQETRHLGHKNNTLVCLHLIGPTDFCCRDAESPRAATPRKLRLSASGSWIMVAVALEFGSPSQTRPVVPPLFTGRVDGTQRGCPGPLHRSPNAGLCCSQTRCCILHVLSRNAPTQRKRCTCKRRV